MSVLPSAQIHYTGRDHWVMSFQNQENEVCILNSLSNTKNHTVNTPSLEIQVSLIYGNKKSSVLLKILENQQQNNGYL